MIDLGDDIQPFSFGNPQPANVTNKRTYQEDTEDDKNDIEEVDAGNKDEDVEEGGQEFGAWGEEPDEEVPISQGRNSM
jgi:hypothetical protein